MSSGRGRGVTNEPAWMSRQQDKDKDRPSGAGGDDNMRGENGADGGGGGGGGGKSRSSRSRSPDRDQYGRIRSGSRDRGGGGGPRRSDENYGSGGGPRRGSRDSGRYRDDYGPYGPPPPRGGYGSGGEGGGGRDRGGGRYSDRGDRRGPPRRGRSPPRRGGGNRSGIYFHSLAEEREWVEERRRKRRNRKSLFDVEPTAEQLALAQANEARVAAAAASSIPNGDGRGGGSSSSGIYGPASGEGGSSGKDRTRLLQAQPQQTRHARRLYIGHLPHDLVEEDVHEFFRDAIHAAMGKVDPTPEDDPILSVYINVERRFAFLEFKTMEVCTAALALDGINILGRGKVKVKRPNDYNPAMAPTPNPALLPNFDVSKLGIVSPSVPDGPNKIFIGGLPYHLTEDQVLELFRAFGQVRAFHLVKADPTAVTSKGYCFVEYADPAVTPVAVMGLNGMDMGGGKVLSARMAAARGTVPPGGTQGAEVAVAQPTAVAAVAAEAALSATTPTSNIVDGVDVEILLDIAMGLKPDTTPVHVGMAPMMQPAIAAVPMMMQAAVPQFAQPQPQALNPVTSVGTVPDAAGGVHAAGVAPPPPPPPPPPAATPAALAAGNSRILVLHNMVMDEDLSTDDDYEGLSDEVREECEKFGRLVSMKIPRPQDGYEPSAIKKIYLEYSSTDGAQNAEKELAGRQFGPNTVQVTYYDEADYLAGKLS